MGEGAEVGGVAKELDERVGGDGRVGDGELREVREGRLGGGEEMVGDGETSQLCNCRRDGQASSVAGKEKQELVRPCKKRHIIQLRLPGTQDPQIRRATAGYEQLSQLAPVTKDAPAPNATAQYQHSHFLSGFSAPQMRVEILLGCDANYLAQEGLGFVTDALRDEAQRRRTLPRSR